MTGWPDGAKEIIAGDLCAAFAYTTRFGGVSVAPVCPFGIFDEDTGTIETSVPMAFADKLRRLAVAPEAALGFFTRTHGKVTTPGYVLAQGDVTFPDAVPAGYLDALHARWPAFLGSVPDGGLVRRLGGDSYYDKRLPVTLHVRRLLYWQEGDAAGEPVVIGAPRPVPPPPQRPPKQGTEPVVAPKKYAKQMGRSTDHLLGFVDGDGRPFVIPISPQVTDGRISVAADRLPTGGRRAAVMGLWFNSRLHGQGMWGARGWLDVSSSDATFAPSASNGFNLSMGAFGQKVLVPIALGFDYRKAVRSGAVRDGRFVRGDRPTCR